MIWSMTEFGYLSLSGNSKRNNFHNGSLVLLVIVPCAGLTWKQLLTRFS